MYLIRSGAFEGLGRLIQSLGANPVTLAKEVGLTPAQFRNPNGYISYNKVAELLEKAAVACNTPFLGLMLAPRQDMGVFRDLVASICQEPTVGDAIRKMDHYLYLHASGIHVTQESRGENIRIHIKFDFNTPFGTDQLLQFSVGRLIHLIETLMNGDPYRFGIFLQQSIPAGTIIPDKPPFSQIQFSGPFDGMQISAKALAQKPNVDKNALQVHFNEYLQYLKERYPNNLQNQTKEIIGRLLPSGDCSIEKVAVNKGMISKIRLIKIHFLYIILHGY